MILLATLLLFQTASAEFVERSDALPAFQAAYGFKLGQDQILTLAGGDTAVTIKAATRLQRSNLRIRTILTQFRLFLRAKNTPGTSTSTREPPRILLVL